MIDYDDIYEIQMWNKNGEYEDTLDMCLSYKEAINCAKNYSEIDSEVIYVVMGPFVVFDSVEKPRPKAKVNKTILVV